MSESTNVSGIVTPDGVLSSVVTLDAYQDAAGKYQVPHARPEERVFGLLEESGEVAGIFKRIFRGDYPTAAEAEDKLRKELGDCLWYISRIAADNGWPLQRIANENLAKLESRKQRNVLQGSGDNR